MERLCEVISRNHHLGVEEIRQVVIKDVRRHIAEPKVFVKLRRLGVNSRLCSLHLVRKCLLTSRPPTAYLYCQDFCNASIKIFANRIITIKRTQSFLVTMREIGIIANS